MRATADVLPGASTQRSCGGVSTPRLTHPGVILTQEFLAPLGISQVALAAHLGVPVQRVNELG